MFEIIQPIDFQILDWIQAHLRCGWMDWLMPKITSLGAAGLIWIVLSILLLWRKGHRKCGVKMIVSLVLCLVIGLLLLKNIIARPRPCWINDGIAMLVAVPKDYSFPSGHTMSSISSAVLLFREDRKIGIPACILAVLIAFSRLYLYVHFPSDVFAGTVIGILLAVMADKLVDKLMPRMPAKMIAFVNAGSASQEMDGEETRNQGDDIHNARMEK